MSDTSEQWYKETPRYEAPPVVKTISDEDYRADRVAEVPSLSCSIAKTLITQSPLHAMLQHPRLNPHYKRDEDSRMELGTAAHSMLLERDASKIVWCEFDDWRKNIAKETRDAARAKGQLPILVKFKPVLETMVKRATEFLSESEIPFILEGEPEKVIVWREGDTVCRAKPDMLSKCKSVIMDLKTTEDASPEAFIRQIPRLNYEMQAAWYLRGLRATEPDCERSVFVFFVQEINPPFACSLMSLSNSYMALGESRCSRALSLWRRCLSEQKWPGYPTNIHYAEPAPWLLSEIQSPDGEEL